MSCFGQETIDSRRLRKRGLRRWRLEIESVLRTLQPRIAAHIPNDGIPRCREVLPRNGVVDGGDANPERQSDLGLPELIRDMTCFFHTTHNPHFVDQVNTTTRGLQIKSHLVDQGGMSEDAPYADIAARLIAIRKSQSDDNQKEWAERHGFSPTQYNNWEKGTRRISVDCAEKLCNLYGITLDFIYRGRRDGLSENIRKAV